MIEPSSLACMFVGTQVASELDITGSIQRRLVAPVARLNMNWNESDVSARMG